MRSIVTVCLSPYADGSRSVCFWGWAPGEEPDQGRPFTVPSLDVVRDLVPPRALQVTDAPAGTAIGDLVALCDEVWVYEWDLMVPVPTHVDDGFGTEPTVVDAAPDLRAHG